MAPGEGVDEGSETYREVLQRGIDDSSVLGAFEAVSERIASAARASYLYRWLTKEPEAEVIVIDLRETYTIGPVIALLDRLIEWLAPYWRESTLKQGIDSLVTLSERAAETRPGQLLATVLTPPETPEQNGLERDE